MVASVMQYMSKGKLIVSMVACAMQHINWSNSYLASNEDAIKSGKWDCYRIKWVCQLCV